MSLAGNLATRAATGCSLLACLMASSCGGGGSGSGASPAEPNAQGLGSDALAVNFPFGHAAYGASSVTVSGSLNHSEFAELNEELTVVDSKSPMRTLSR